MAAAQRFTCFFVVNPALLWKAKWPFSLQFICLFVNVIVSYPPQKRIMMMITRPDGVKAPDATSDCNNASLSIQVPAVCFHYPWDVSRSRLESSVQWNWIRHSLERHTSVCVYKIPQFTLGQNTRLEAVIATKGASTQYWIKAQFLLHLWLNVH